MDQYICAISTTTPTHIKKLVGSCRGRGIPKLSSIKLYEFNVVVPYRRAFLIEVTGVNFVLTLGGGCIQRPWIALASASVWPRKLVSLTLTVSRWVGQMLKSRFFGGCP